MEDFSRTILYQHRKFEIVLLPSLMASEESFTDCFAGAVPLTWLPMT